MCFHKLFKEKPGVLSCFLSVNEEYVKDMLIFWGKTGKENDRLGEER